MTLLPLAPEPCAAPPDRDKRAAERRQLVRPPPTSLIANRRPPHGPAKWVVY
jgi:hypothetical protein